VDLLPQQREKISLASHQIRHCSTSYNLGIFT